MREERIDVGKNIYYLRDDGRIRVHEEAMPTVDTTIGELVYIAMRWQELFGAIPLHYYSSDWKGVEGQKISDAPHNY